MIRIRTEFIVLLSILTGFMLLSAIGTLLKLDRFGFLFFPLGVIFKTELFNRILVKMGQKGKRFWSIMYNVGKVLSFIITGALLLFFIINPFLIIFGSPFKVGMQLIIPGVTIELKTALLFIVPFILVLIPHEIAHAVMAEREGIEIKSSGLLIFLVMFGGFVELAKESMEKADFKKRIRVFLNGSAINSVMAVIFLGIFFLTPFINLIGYEKANGALITKVYEDFPAAQAGIVRGDVISDMGLYNETTQVIDYQKITTVNDYHSIVATYDDETTVYLKLLSGREVTLIPTYTDPITNEPLSSGQLFLGLSISNYFPPRVKGFSPFLPYYWQIEVLYIVNLSVMAVFINMLPLYATDGDKILQDYLKMKNKNEKTRKRILSTVRVSAIVIIALNLILSMSVF